MHSVLGAIKMLTAQYNQLFNFQPRRSDFKYCKISWKVVPLLTETFGKDKKNKNEKHLNVTSFYRSDLRPLI